MHRACFAINATSVAISALDYGSSIPSSHRARSSASGAQKFLLLALLPVTANFNLPHVSAIESCAAQSVEVRGAVFDRHFKPSWDLAEHMTPIRVALPKTKVAKFPRPLLRKLFVITVKEKKYLLRAVVAVLCGSIIGFERQSAHSLAGVRVCSLVSLGTAIFFSISLALSKNAGGLGRAVASAATSVGFLGANVLTLKSGREFRRGLTTSCGIWLSAACGIGQSPWKEAPDMRYLRH